MKRLSILLFVFVFVTSCHKEDNEQQQSIPAQNYIGVSYGSDTSQKMDIYLPAGRSDTTKLIILIHGGSWMEGDKDDFLSYIPVLQQNLPEYAIANINYRLATSAKNHFPTQENDVKSATAFLVNKAAEYHISHTVVLLGASAGAQLALLQAYKDTTTVKAKAVVDFFGPTDLVDMYNHPLNPLIPIGLQTLLNGTPTTNTDLYLQSSPIHFVSAQSCPTIILQGGADPMVNPAQSTQLRDKLLSFGVTTQYVFYPTEGHGWFDANLNDSFNKIFAFIRANVK